MVNDAQVRVLRQKRMEDKTMEAAAGLQAPLVCTDLGPLPAPPAGRKPVKKVTPEMAGLILLPESLQKEPEPAPSRRFQMRSTRDGAFPTS